MTKWAYAVDFQWFIHHRPPLRIWQDDQQVTGQTVEKARKIFDQSQLTYEIKKSTSSRTLTILEQNKIAACSEGWYLTPERRKKLWYSKPFFKAQGSAVMTKSSNKDVLRHETFGSLYSDADLVFGHRAKRSYGKKIDEMIATHNPRMVTHNLTNEGSLEMLLNGSYDYQLVTVDTAQYLISSVQMGQELLSVKRMDDEPEIAPRYIICSKKVPPHVIQKMNKTIDEMGIDLKS